MSDKKIHVWTCKLVVFADDLPDGFDLPPRMAAETAIAEVGNVIMNRAGWGGELDEFDREYLELRGYKRSSDAYIAGLMDAPEDVEH